MNLDDSCLYPTDAWENQTLTYDLARFDWPQWILAVIQEIVPQVQDLTKFHEMVPVSKLTSVRAHVQQAFLRTFFMQQFDDFAQTYLASLVQNQPYLIKRQPTLNVVIPNQDQAGGRLTFHTGLMVCNGRGQRTIWMPLTKTEGTNSMYITDLHKSRMLNRAMIKNNWSLERYEQECLKVCQPVAYSPGQAHLFHQEHVHGNVNNVTGYTRMAIDWHILPLGAEYGRRLPGGFFRLPGDHGPTALTDYKDKSFVAYGNHNTKFSSGIPLPYQRPVIDDYCRRKGIVYAMYNSELEYFDWCPLLEHFIRQKPHGIVMTSIYSLPDDQARRKQLLELALEQKVQLHFANEICILATTADLVKINTYLDWGTTKQCNYSWED